MKFLLAFIIIVGSLLFALVMAAMVTFILSLLLGYLAFIIGPVVGVGVFIYAVVTLLASIKTKNEMDSANKQATEAHVIAKINAGIPLTPQEKVVHAEMISAGEQSIK